MSYRFVLIILLILGGSYIFWVSNNKTKPNIPPPPPMLKSTAFEPLALTPEQEQKVRDAAKDSDPRVRWAAVELMYRFHDPKAISVLQQTLSMEIEPSIRKKAVVMLKDTAEKQSENRSTAIQNLILALKDPDKDMRIAALLALGDIGDFRAVPAITEMLDDYDSEVRMQALHTLGELQDKRQAAYQVLIRQLRNEYDAAAKRGQKIDQKSETGNRIEGIRWN